MSPIALLLIQSLIIVAGPVLIWHGLKLQRIVPLAVLQILSGIALGPSLFGRFFPHASAWLFNSTSLGALSGLAAIAVLLFGFVAGLHLTPGSMRDNSSRGQSGLLIRLIAGSILVPTLLGGIAGLACGFSFPLAAATGISAGVTALPVLAAILRENGLSSSRLGQSALRIAAANDAGLWILLALLLAAGSDHRFLLILLAGPIWFLGLPKLIRRASPWLLGHEDRLMAVAGTYALASGLLTEWLGLQYILGAFLAGATMPVPLREELLVRLESSCITLLMPFFFMLTGLRTSIDPHATEFWIVLTVAMLSAVIGKMAGVAVMGRIGGESWRFGLALGALLQTKGLMEVIVVNMLRTAHLIDDDAFSALIVMALICTAIAMPLAKGVLGNRSVMVEAASFLQRHRS
ncbi:cation:proton antiporter [Granulibacter bethesdensis]|uniref:cation:proton antiporter n=1 Tax=Granulibacter bethesdensis TaxID=364410 RepID=UPI0003F1E0DE|nr:cation:proton antiporter [Granulibacter bethesdensis]AHJ66677.1 Na(+)/H(+) antiporter [Granulibacter bethesdensis CGDNIH4]